MKNNKKRIKRFLHLCLILGLRLKSLVKVLRRSWVGWDWNQERQAMGLHVILELKCLLRRAGHVYVKIVINSYEVINLSCRMSQTAAKKSSAVIKLDNLTECCICLKTFIDPRMLPCIHTFCLQCLNDLADKSNKKAAGEEIPCPVCRKEFTIPRDGVHGIQKNFFMAGMTEVRNALNQSNVKGLLCDICKANYEGHAVKIAEATNRCSVCQKNLCDSCCKMHKTFKVSINHDPLRPPCDPHDLCPKFGGRDTPKPPGLTPLGFGSASNICGPFDFS